MRHCLRPLACHVLQRCVKQWVLLPSEVWQAGAQQELEQWFETVLHSIVQCLRQAREQPSDGRALQCAIFQLELCNIVLSRTSPSAKIVRDVSCEDTFTHARSTDPMDNRKGRHFSESTLAQQVCAKVVCKYLPTICRGGNARSGGIPVTCDGNPCSSCDAREGEGCRTRKDYKASYWVLMVLGAVLEHFLQQTGVPRDFHLMAGVGCEFPPANCLSEERKSVEMDLDGLVQLMSSLMPPCAFAVTFKGQGHVDTMIKWLEVAMVSGARCNLNILLHCLEIPQYFMHPLEQPFFSPYRLLHPHCAHQHCFSHIQTLADVAHTSNPQ
ncbi:unnamed protein product, partial [Choristocarpus tenellus]